MVLSVAEFVVERLQEWGVRRVFGAPGDAIQGLTRALHDAGPAIELYVQPYDEMAAYMACAHAKFSGELGVCLAAAGPGALRVLGGLYDASMDHQPMVALIGQQSTSSLGAAYQQEVDLVSLFKDVAHQFCHMCLSAASARHLVDRAIRIAQAERAVTCVIFPSDIQELDITTGTELGGRASTRSGVGFVPPRVLPRTEELERAADVLNSGHRVAMLVGAGAQGCEAALLGCAERLGAGIAKALLGKAVVPDTLPYVTGAIGTLGTKASDEMMRACDTLFMIGSSFPFSEWLPEEGTARGVQIDIDPRMLSLRYPMEVALCGDIPETLHALLPLLQEKADTSWRAQVERWVTEWWNTLDRRAHLPADPLNPQLVFWELSPRLPERAILTTDAGASVSWWARHLRVRSGMLASLSGNLASVGPGLPYALAAKLAWPDRPVVACVSDRAMQQSGMNVLLSVARLWRGWADPRFIIVVLNRRHARPPGVWAADDTSAPAASFEPSDVLPDRFFSEYARMLGMDCVTLSSFDEVPRGLEQAVCNPKPILVEAITDPAVTAIALTPGEPRMPSKSRSWVAGDPQRWRSRHRPRPEGSSPSAP